MPTRRDVANLAGVSTATVSHVINGTKFVSEDLKIRVNQAIKELDYKPDLIARSLSKKNSNHVAMVINDITNPCLAEIFLGFEREAKKNGYIVSIIPVSNRMEDYFDDVVQRYLDGIFISTVEYGFTPEQIEDLSRRKTAIVTGDIPVKGCSRVVCDYWQGYMKVIRHLKNLGHTKIAFLAGVSESSYDARLEMFRQAMVENGLPVEEELIVAGCHPYETNMTAGMRAVQALFDKACPFTAVVALNDLMATGAILALRERGLSIPQDISVVGCDDSFFAEYASLTTIRTPKEEIGKMAFREILRSQKAMSDGEEHYVSSIKLPVEVILRETTGRACGCP